MNAHQRRVRRRREDRGYQGYLDAECSPTICGGVAQGSFCDRRCVCARDDDQVDEDYNEEH